MNKVVTLFILLSVLIVNGCSTFETPSYHLKQKEFRVKIFINPKLKTDGLSMWRKGYCEIYLRRYPICLKHEIRHCIEGQWHNKKPNGEDC